MLKHEKGWFRQTIAIEDPFELSHNLAGGLSIRSMKFHSFILIEFVWILDWTIIRRVFIRARQQFGLQAKDVEISKPDLKVIEVSVFDAEAIRGVCSIF